MTGQTFGVVNRSDQPIHSVEEWLSVAPPAGGERQWREGRSAMELACRWMGGRVPDEVASVLATHAAFAEFDPEQAIAEVKTPLDNLRGNTRNHDLLVIGRCGGERALLDIEGKADEPFGDTIAQRLAKARAMRSENPRSRAAERVESLCAWVLGAEPEEVGGLRYQLLHALGAAVLAAQTHGAHQVAWLAHEFRTPGVTSERRHQANADDLDAFVARLVAPGTSLPSSGRLVGPLTFRGDRGSAGISLYAGKAVCVPR